MHLMQSFIFCNIKRLVDAAVPRMSMQQQVHFKRQLVH
jgi:hypothetical protein